VSRPDGAAARSARRSTLVAGAGLVLALVLAATALAAAKAFVPKAGEYTGTVSGSAGPLPGLGAVEKSGGKYIFQLRSGAGAKCSEGLITQLPIGIVVPIKGKSFKAEETVPNPQSGAGSNEVMVKVSGHFTSPTKLTGSAIASTAVEAGIPPSKSCTTGNVKFTLKKK
jgi:hypothetical protein